MQIIGLILAGMSAILGGSSVVATKAGMGKADVYWVNGLSNTIIFCMFAAAAILFGSFNQWGLVESWPLLTASGFFLGISWVFYYLGLKDGPVSVVLALQNLSIVMTMVLSAVILREHISGAMLAGAVLMAAGTVLMIERDEENKSSQEKNCASRKWIVYEVLSAACISVSHILTKMDSSPVDSNFASGIRYFIVMIMMWILYLAKQKEEKPRSRHRQKAWSLAAGDLVKIVLGAILLGGGYIFFYKALIFADVNVVTTIFRMSIILSAVLSAVFLKEAMLRKKIAAILIMTAALALYVM
ncbi:DMT family transporter [Anaerotruncus sp. 80]|uniref:DMT family transporter n=1 Tax=Anaerotruncus colihominis TaxID=169435 RepID=A0A845QI46_9FIRM|nr:MULTISPECIES: EamA family transporter [Anaerotruncus]NBH60443.1 DMT family transporter [Anaerotruncus colihominis]NCF01097.1 DMT family transporter [Anaerotruncus sp. 80]